MPNKADDSTVGELKAMVKIPGALKVITSEIRPELREDRGNSKEARRSGLAAAAVRRTVEDASNPFTSAEDMLRSPSTFVCHDVTRIESYPAKDGVYIAYTDEGDWTMGYADHLLRRLRQWRDG